MEINDIPGKKKRKVPGAIAQVKEWAKFEDNIFCIEF